MTGDQYVAQNQGLPVLYQRLIILCHLAHVAQNLFEEHFGNFREIVWLPWMIYGTCLSSLQIARTYNYQRTMNRHRFRMA